MFFKSLPFQLVLCLAFAVLFGDYLPENSVRIAYTISCQFKEVLMTILPFVIFTYISTAILSLDKSAPWLVFGIIGLVVVMNAVTVCVSYAAAYTLLPYLADGGSGVCNITQKAIINSYNIIEFPKPLSPDKVLLFALAFGVIFSYFKVPTINHYALKFQQLVTTVLTRFLIPLLPLYILGFALKMKHEGGLFIICQSYSHIFMGIFGLMIAYITVIYALASGLQPAKILQTIRHMLPAGITGFSTMSSAATMPVTIDSTLKNIPNLAYVELVIPTTMNIHMMGDAICLPFLTFGVMAMFGQPMPSFEPFLAFVPAFCLAKFSLASIPGGTIAVMLPILQAHFNLSQDVMTLLTTLYILQDPFFTCGNVMGNGAFAMGSYKILRQGRIS